MTQQVDDFRTELGGALNTPDGTNNADGRREINWYSSHAIMNPPGCLA